jgi:hypothetical protein
MPAAQKALEKRLGSAIVLGAAVTKVTGQLQDMPDCNQQEVSIRQQLRLPLGYELPVRQLTGANQLVELPSLCLQLPEA